MSSFLIRNRQRLVVYNKIFDKNMFGFFSLNLVNEDKPLRISNRLLLILISLKYFNFFKGSNYFYNFDTFSILMNKYKVFDKLNYYIYLVKLNNLYLTVDYFKSNIIPFTTSYTLFENLNLSILILFFKFFIKLFLSLLFFPINFLTTTYGKR